MGACSSRLNTTVDLGIDNKARPSGDSYKILLLGPGEAGKSTFLKQMVNLYGDENLEDNLDLYRDTVYGNVIEAICVLLRKSEEYGGERPEFNVSQDLADAVERIIHLEQKSGLSPSIDEEIAEQIDSIWSDAGIQKTFKRRTSFKIQETAPHFFEKIREIGGDDYTPTREDILLCRIRTLGMNTLTFEFGSVKFNILDVGGQRSERRKWIKNFENCRAVIFFAAMSDYSTTIYEDPDTNGLSEALKLFEQISNSHWFEHSDMILFLNKMDMFEEKLKQIPLSKYYPDFDGGSDLEAGKLFIRNQFTKLYHMKTHPLTTHFTVMTDGTSIDALFEDIAKLLLVDQLNELGNALEN